MTLDIDAIRSEFPVLQREIGKGLVYLDNAATSHTPRTVLDASRRYYEHTNSNIHRGTTSWRAKRPKPTRRHAKPSRLT